MGNVESLGNNKQKGITKAQEFLDKWKKIKKEDELKFQRDLNNPILKQKMEAIKGKIVKNGNASTPE